MIGAHKATANRYPAGPFRQKGPTRRIPISPSPHLPISPSLFLLVTLSASTLSADTSTFNALNWAGYADVPSPSTTGAVTGVGGSWIVPTAGTNANTSGNEPQCAAWVGIDGFGNSTVEQIGTNSYIFNGTARYYAWYEMYPDPMIQIYSNQIGTISPGDSITASVQYGLPNYPNEFALTISDSSTGRSFTTYQGNSSASQESAEWIAEAPTGGSGVLPLPEVGSVLFTNSWATIDGTTGPIDDPDWQEWQVNLIDARWSDMLTPSPVLDSLASPAESNFTVEQAPEPSTLVLLVTAGAVWAAVRFRVEKRRSW
jgi:hypothetical protein